MSAKMQRAILYYPTIKIRNTNWLKQVVLYWDIVGTIVPHEFEGEAYEAREFQDLREHGLLRFYNPEYYVSEGEQLTEEFIRLRNSPKYQSLYRREKNSPTKFEVYGDKIPPRLQEYIRDNQLAQQRTSDTWPTITFALNRLDGLLFMSLLAKYLADEDHLAATTPGTDYRAYQELALLVGVREDSIPVLTLTLERILPVPRPDVTLAQILEFKRNRSLELLQFRQVIDEIQSKLKAVTSPGELQHVIVASSEMIKMQVEILDRLLNDSHIAATYSTLDSIMSIDRPAVLGELLGAIANPTPLNLLSKAVNGVIKVSGQRINAANEKRRTLMASSHSYLYEAYKEGIIDRP